VKVRWSHLAVIAALLWLFAVTAAYYVAHKPFTIAHLLAMAPAAAGLAGAGLVVLLGAGIGLPFLPSRTFAPLERLVWATALGLGGVSLLGLGLGALGLLRSWLLWLLTALGLALTGRSTWRALRAAWRDPRWKPRGRFSRWLALYCAAMLTLALVPALAPPSAWDSLVYHLTSPKLYLTAGRVGHPLDLPYLGFPQLAEMLFAWGMGLTGERAAAPLHWFYALLAVLALVSTGRRLSGDAVGWLAAALLLSSLTVVRLAGQPYVDLTLLLYTTLAVAAVWRARRTERRAWLLFGGAFAGLALSSKYTALAILPGLLLVLLPGRRSPEAGRGRRLWRSAQDGLIVCAVAVALWSPWLVKNFLLTGNPTYPFFFGGIHWDAWRSWWYDRPGTGLAYSAPWKLITAPWDMTIWGVEERAGYGATLGPLFLALLPFLALAWPWLPLRKRRWVASVVPFCAVVYAFWLWGIARSRLLLQSRLLLPIFPLLALSAAIAVEGLRSLPSPVLKLDWIARAVVTTVLLLSLLGTTLSTLGEDPLPVLVGFESRDAFLIRRLGWYYVAIDTVNRTLPADAAVLLLWEPRSYHCVLECRPDALLDRFLHASYLHDADAQTIAQAWREEGVTHVLLHRAGMEFVLQGQFDSFSEADRAALESLQHNELRETRSFGEAYVLYALEEPRTSSAPLCTRSWARPAPVRKETCPCAN